jgi:high-affinity Fe2+/Pb2+ permease
MSNAPLGCQNAVVLATLAASAGFCVGTVIGVAVVEGVGDLSHQQELATVLTPASLLAVLAVVALFRFCFSQSNAAIHVGHEQLLQGSPSKQSATAQAFSVRIPVGPSSPYGTMDP